MTPAVFDALAPTCFGRDARPGGGERAIPCDLVPKGRWSEADLARLRNFAATLPADVIALQEIDGEEVAREIFPAHAFCFTKRKQVQNVGFAIRKGLKFRCNRDYRALGLPENVVRWGADVTIEPGTPREFRLLAVHLKASCNRDPLTESPRRLPDPAAAGAGARGVDRPPGGGRRGLRRDRRLQPPLRPGTRRGTGRQGRYRRPVAGDRRRRADGADLVNPGADHGAVGCGNGHGERMPIDYLILGERLAGRQVPGSFRVWDYPGGGRWPDHCVISVELNRET